MINLVLVNILLNNRDAVISGLTDKTWLELEKIGLGGKVQEYLEGSIKAGRMLTAIRRSYGKDSEEYESLYETYTSMRISKKTYTRLTITIPPSVDAVLELFKIEGGKKSQFASACMDNIISKLDKDPQRMLEYVHKWLITERTVDPNIPESALAVRKQKADLDAAVERRENSRKKRLQREKEEQGRTRSKEEKDSMMKQQQAINKLMNDFKRKNGRKPTREEYVELMTTGKTKHPITTTDEKKPTTSEEIAKSLKKQQDLNKKAEDKENEKSKRNKNGLLKDDW